jgi:hypothetical protein
MPHSFSNLNRIIGLRLKQEWHVPSCGARFSVLSWASAHDRGERTEVRSGALKRAPQGISNLAVGSKTMWHWGF